jgi:hypothetical protein
LWDKKPLNNIVAAFVFLRDMIVEGKRDLDFEFCSSTMLIAVSNKQQI